MSRRIRVVRDPFARHDELRRLLRRRTREWCDLKVLSRGVTGLRGIAWAWIRLTFAERRLRSAIRHLNRLERDYPYLRFYREN